METETVISFRDFSFKYRTQIAPTLTHITLHIHRGEKVLIAGPSGSGKSTLAQCINGLIPSSFPGEIQGELRVNGLDPVKEGIFGMAKQVGTVLQDTDGQFIGLTVGEDIAFALENDLVPRAEMETRVQTAAQLVGIENRLSSSPRSLSGGQKQRVSMAGVLVDNVPILLFDEPLANLDPAAGKKAVALIDSIQKEQGKTVIIIEHRLEDVLYRDVDRIILMNQGKIICDASPRDMLCGNILAEQGIREPLYIAALKLAGCSVLPETRPEHVETLDCAPYREALRAWFTKAPPAPVPPLREEILALENVSFSYGDSAAPVLDEVTLRIHRGEMLSLVGKNGAGKSTLSSLVMGFLSPDSGRILLEGADIQTLSIKERGERIGLVMQNPNQMISKPLIFDEVALGLAVRGVPPAEIEKRVHEVLHLCGLYPFRHWPVNALSFGQKKRVTIASILVLNPSVLILDEPTAGQDWRHYTDIMEFLKQLNETEGITIILITHDMHLMLEYTSRAVVLCDGKIIADDKSSRILTDESLVERAHLKKTSLFDLAVQAGLDSPAEFAERFIYAERRAAR